MMRSLWAGVTGLQAHQIAMDVESNNIANVNTTGYKYSRANFSNLLNQTVSIATAPQGELGGKNATQIGLGTQVSSVTKIFKQGSIETTDKTTDLAISGDGFYVVSADGGTTYKYTRSGDFSFDANGNFVDSNGYIVQGWLRDSDTGQIDTTSPISNITIPPGLTTPANATSVVTVKANLDSGDSVGKLKTTIYSLDANHGWVDLDNDGILDAGTGTNDEIHDEDDTADTRFNSDTEVYERGIDFGVLFDADGNAINLTDGQGAWISYAKAKSSKITVEAASNDTTQLTMTINGTTISTGTISTTTYSTKPEKDAAVATAIAAAINAKTSSTGVTASISGGNNITLSNDNSTGTEEATKNIKVAVDETASDPKTGFTDMEIITAYKYTYSTSTANTTFVYDDSQERTFTSTEDLRYAMQTDARLYVDYSGDGSKDVNDGVTITVNDAGQYVIANPKGDAFNSDDGDFTDSTSTTYTKNTLELNEGLSKGGISFPADTVFNDTIYPSSNVTITVGGAQFTYGPTGADGTSIPSGTSLGATATIPQGSAVGTPTLTTATDLDTALSTSDVAIAFGTTINADITLPSTYTGTLTIAGIEYTGGDTIPSGAVATASEGTIIIPKGSTVDTATGGSTNILASSGTNTVFKVGTNFLSDDDYNLYLTVTGFTDTKNNISANSKFVSSLSSLQGTLEGGTATRTSQSIYAASLASSTDVYDSLGSKHTIRFQYTKTGFTETGGTEWSVTISVPEPGDINLGQTPKNVVTGSIRFNSDGSLSTYTPRNLTYTANNGSTASQNIQLNFGTVGQLDGVTSFDKTSSVSGISQDGYAGGDLNGISVDETGTIIGSFTNGRSFGLAQVSMATFTNNGGLESDGGNCYIQTSNSGDPVIGQASTGGKGSIQSSSLEMSNVDLSRSLTQLIVIQRGYQANSKTITTSDEMLNTLLQLK